MTINLIKLCVGIDTAEALEAWQAVRRKELPGELPRHVTRMWPKRAVEVLASKPQRGRAAPAAPLKELGDHPDGGGAVSVMKGRYGPYVKWEKINATLPKDVDPEGVTLEQAVELIAAPTIPGSRPCMGDMALNKCVKQCAPASKAA